MEGLLLMAAERVELTIDERVAIRGRIAQTGFVQILLARILRIQQSTLNNYLAGRPAPTHIIAAIAALLVMPDLQKAYPEDLDAETVYARQREALTLLNEVWVGKLSHRARAEHYTEYAWLIEKTPPYGPKPISMMLRAYAGSPMPEVAGNLAGDPEQDGA